MNKRSHITFSSNTFVYFLMLLAVFNFFLLGNYIVFGAIAVLLLFRRRILADNMLLCLSAFAFFYMLGGMIDGLQDDGLGGLISAFSIFVMPCAYYVGRFMYDKISFAEVRKAILCVAGAMSFHMALNFFYNIMLYGSGIFSRNTFYDIFSRTVSSATGQTAYSYFFCAALMYVIVTKMKAWHKLLIFAGYALLAIYSLALGGRTYFLLSFVSILIGFVVYCKTTPKKTYALRLLLIFLIVIIAIVVLFQLNAFGVNESFEKTYFYKRFFFESDYRQDVYSDERMNIKLEYVKHMLEYPFGGGHISDAVGNYAHELWLDTYDVGGVGAYIMLILFSLSSVKKFFSCARQKILSAEDKVLLIALVCTINVAFFIEPTISGAPMVFVGYCFITGMISNYLRTCGEGKTDADT